MVARFPDGKRVNFLLDLGQFSEPEYNEDKKYNETIPFNAMNISFVVATHVHMDHIGRIPMLFNQGYRGEVYTSWITEMFMADALADTCNILRQKAKDKKKKPIFDENDLKIALDHVHGLEYYQEVNVHEHISLKLHQNGHTIDSSAVEVVISYPEKRDITLLFSGDYSPKNTFKDVPEISKHVMSKHISALFMESTYGDKTSDTIEFCFEKNILNYIQDGYVILVPVFSFQRAQEICLFLKTLQDEEKLSKNIPIYVDGRLTISHTGRFKKLSHTFKESARDFEPSNMKYVTEKELRNSLLASKTCKIILASSGMLCGGPSQTYLWTFLQYKKLLVHLVGYPAEGTLSRKLFEASKVGFLRKRDLNSGKEIEILIEVTVLYTSEFSAHAKKDEILEAVKSLQSVSKIESIHFGHGRYEAKKALSEEVEGIKDVIIEDRSQVVRIGPYGVIKRFSSKFN